jgi:membrane protein DedA with SNARE-associated domain
MIPQLFSHSTTFFSGIVGKYGYLAIFILMILESATLPVPSEVVLPLAGLLAQRGLLSLPLGLLVAVVGSTIGMAIDYYIGYFIGKDVVYKHLRFFHISKASLDSFDRWFERNGDAGVFISRLFPVIRTVISFPAGFAKMEQKKFFLYSVVGTVIWDLVLMLFGFYLLSANRAVEVMAAVAVFGIVLYVLYRIANQRVRKSG